MESPEIIRLLNEDLRGEHGAIILYLRIAYGMDDAGMAASVESIARDEMRHYKWLAEEIVRRGGAPTLEREPEPENAGDPLSRMRVALKSEEEAIGVYAAHAEAIGEPRVTALLGRIASDERYHFGKFERFIQALEAREPAEGEAAETPAPAELEPIQQDVVLEYTTLLQYLQQSFLTPDCPLSKDLQDQATIEMKHMGWLAEYVADANGDPRMEFGPIDSNPDPEHILQTNIQLEVDVEDVYQRQMEGTGDPKLRALLERVLDHSVYHEAHFRDLLTDVQARRSAAEEAPAPPRTPPSGTGWTVGSLLGRKQES